MSVKVCNSHFRGCVVAIDKRRGTWCLIQKSTGITLDYGSIRRTGWGFLLSAGRN